ncbi:dedicator of cytokinesis protein 7-like [Centruroides sculpturatus]|uniref:dedicator of cytokinesis protein 7-like n=1 Tax=Centruroides sculpturatus TaxID=218467 RepID=UPI000C6DA7ED|nr:dedicator of cytokinesis protein 7-like [Centruroides sculpturatus]
MSAKISSLPDAGHLITLKLEFLRIICSHEHFVTLNLPFATPVSPSPATSPCPSVASSISQSSFVSTSTLTEKGNFAELSVEFRQQHFLVGLVLSDLATVLEINNPAVHAKAVNTIRNLLTCHDWDPRFAEPEYKARVAALYLPLIGIVIDTLPQLYDWQSEAKSKI